MENRFIEDFSILPFSIIYSIDDLNQKLDLFTFLVYILFGTTCSIAKNENHWPHGLIMKTYAGMGCVKKDGDAGNLVPFLMTKHPILKAGRNSYPALVKAVVQLYVVGARG